MPTLRVRFSGLCHFVENEGKGRCRMCVVLPNADDHEARITPMDGTEIKIGDELVPAISLQGVRIIFSLNEDVPRQGLDFSEGLKGVVKMEDIVGPDFADGDPEVVTRRPPSSVRSQVLLEKGTFKVDPEFGIESWQLPATFTGRLRSVQVAGEIFIENPDLNGAELVVMPFDQDLEHATTHQLVPNGDGVIDLLLGNDCQGRDLLGFELVDRDFLAHYSMLLPSKLEAMRARAATESVELPLPQRDLSRVEDSEVGRERNELRAILGRIIPVIQGAGEDDPSISEDLKRFQEFETDNVKRAFKGEIRKIDLTGSEIMPYSVRTGCNCLRGCGRMQSFDDLDNFLPAAVTASGPESARVRADLLSRGDG